MFSWWKSVSVRCFFKLLEIFCGKHYVIVVAIIGTHALDHGTFPFVWQSSILRYDSFSWGRRSTTMHQRANESHWNRAVEMGY